MTYEVQKRGLDVVCAGLGLLILAPLGLLLAALIKLADGGPVLFGQIRVGRFHAPFRIWKFRSMCVNADSQGGPVTSEADPRITRVGRFLRRTKLDELPQLWNVFVGDMSLVGPRPEVPEYVARYTAEQSETLNYKPGITDLASLLFRKEEKLLRGAQDVEDFYLRYCLPKKLELNLQYGRRATLLQDVWIIVQTLFPYWLGVLLIYSLSLVFSFWLAYQLKADFKASAADRAQFRSFLPWVVLPQLVLLIWRGQVRGLLSYFSVPELRRIAVALGLAVVLQGAACYALRSRTSPSASLLLMDFLLSFVTLCGVRLAFRFFREHSARSQPGPFPPRRVAIIGTGEVATHLLLDLARSENPARQVVAFFDDNPRTWHKRPHDIPVVGMPECLLNREWLERIDEVIVTLPLENAGRIRQLREMLKQLPVKVTLASGWPQLRPFH